MKQYFLAVSIAALLTLGGAAQAGTNVAAGLPDASYSDSSDWNGLNAASLFNGASWNAGGTGIQWVQVDLLGTKQITGISYMTDQLPDDAIWQLVYISDKPIGNDWGNLTPVVTYGAYTVNNTPISFNFGAVGGRYVEIVANNGDSSWTALQHGVITAAVPEPDTYAMMVAGLGLVGFLARRRRKAA